MADDNTKTASTLPDVSIAEDMLLKGDEALSGRSAYMLNPTFGGQLGAKPDYKNWMSSAPYVRQKLIAVLIDPPQLMVQMPQGEARVKMLQSMIELMPVNIEGLKGELTVEWGEHKVSNSGEVHETMTRVGRERSTPTFTWDEKYGKIIYNFLYDWIVYLMADPDTTVPRLISHSGYKGNEFLPHNITATVLFIEPSPTMTTAVSAWLCTNMAPKSSGSNEGKRGIAESNELVQHSIEFTATTQVGANVMKMANAYLDSLHGESAGSVIAGLNSDILPVFRNASSLTNPALGTANFATSATSNTAVDANT